MMPMDRLDAMAAFVTVSDLRGFAPAARRLGLSASRVTRLVAALEDRLSLRLLQRTTRSVTLTDAGARYLERARRILAEVEETEAAARAERSEPSGRLVVAAPLVFGRREVAPLVCELLARHPRISGTLTLADRTVNLVDEGVDVAVRIGHLPDSSLLARKAGETRRVLVAAPRYLETRKRPRAPEDLARHQTISFTALTAEREWRFERKGREERVRLEPGFVTNSADAAIGHALLGGGLALVLLYQVREHVRSGALEVLLPAFEPPPLPIHLVHPASRLPSANVRAFLELAAGRSWRFV